MIATITDRIDAAARKYRIARETIKNLRGEEACSQFRVLEKEDVAPVQEPEMDDKATRKLGRIGGRESRSQKAQSLLKKNMSWIWTEAGSPDEDATEFLYECVSFIVTGFHH